MVPINEVLIAKIVLGYLSSRNLSSTADCFVKECEGFHPSNEPGIVYLLYNKYFLQFLTYRSADHTALRKLPLVIKYITSQNVKTKSS